MRLVSLGLIDGLALPVFSNIHSCGRWILGMISSVKGEACIVGTLEVLTMLMFVISVVRGT